MNTNRNLLEYWRDNNVNQVLRNSFRRFHGYDPVNELLLEVDRMNRAIIERHRKMRLVQIILFLVPLVSSVLIYLFVSPMQFNYFIKFLLVLTPIWGLTIFPGTSEESRYKEFLEFENKFMIELWKLGRLGGFKPGEAANFAFEDLEKAIRNGVETSARFLKRAESAAKLIERMSDVSQLRKKEQECRTQYNDDYHMAQQYGFIKISFAAFLESVPEKTHLEEVYSRPQD
jgi:hypothetical protein